MSSRPVGGPRSCSYAALLFFSLCRSVPRDTPSPPSFPTRRSSDLNWLMCLLSADFDRDSRSCSSPNSTCAAAAAIAQMRSRRSEEHTSELQSRGHLVCRLLLEKKKIADDSVTGANQEGILRTTDPN